jgi:hypothetical protein
MSSTIFYNSQNLVGIGSVGIGLTSPLSSLHVLGGITGTYAATFLRCANGSGGAFAASNVISIGYNGSKDFLNLHVPGNSGACDTLPGITLLATSSTTAPNVGIGTTNPTQLLELYSSASAGSHSTLFTGNRLPKIGGGNGKNFLQIQCQDVTTPVLGSNITFFTDATSLGPSIEYCSSFHTFLNSSGTAPNVGIGVNNPIDTLQVVNSAGIYTNNENTGGNQLSLRNSGTNNTTLYMGADNTNNIGYIQAVGASAYQPLVLQGRGGRVGIGAVSPQGNLHVNAAIGSVAGIIIGPTGAYTATGVQASLAMLNDGMTSGQQNSLQIGKSGVNSLFITYNYTGTASTDYTALTPYGSAAGTSLVVQGSGRVGIGNTNPGYTLDVNGSFRAIGSSASVSINSAGQLVPTGAGGVATNTAVGQYAMQSNSTGQQNTAVGQGAMQNNTTGYFNTAVGTSAMYNNTSGQGNTAVGTSAMQTNTTGQQNTAVGQGAMQNNTTGQGNTAVGTSAMYNNTTGQQNTAVGQGAMFSNTTGQGNTAVGTSAMYNNTTGQNNVGLGESSGADGFVNITTQSNYVVLGNNSTATLYCKTNTINTSDARDKTNVEFIAVGLDYVRKLKPVTFNFDDRGWYPEGQAPDGSKACSIHRLGFLAQDILAAEQELGLPFNHVVNTDFPEKLGIAPTNLIPILVKAIQELEQSLATATANISSLEQSLATVTANISSLQPPSAPANPQSSP